MLSLRQSVSDLLGLSLTDGQLQAFERYRDELLDWNSRFNLTAILEPQQVLVKHFLDSLSCLKVLHAAPGQRMIDVGSGAGFPGLPLKIVCPQLALTLVESVGKKAAFCRHMVQVLGLEMVEVLTGRVETLGQAAGHREQYDWALARAVAGMPVLAEFLLPLVKIGGSMLAMKGENAPTETQAAEHAIRKLGGRLVQMAPVQLPGLEEIRYLVVVEKINATPPAYPRHVGIPAKRPL